MTNPLRLETQSQSYVLPHNMAILVIGHTRTGRLTRLQYQKVFVVRLDYFVRSEKITNSPRADKLQEVFYDQIAESSSETLGNALENAKALADANAFAKECERLC
jgi:hypothetical protein